MAVYDLLLKNARVVDPASEVDDLLDVAIADGKIEAVEPSISEAQADDVIDLRDRVVMPGIIDTHIHVARADRAMGYRMVAETGVTTGLDMGSTAEQFVATMEMGGSGMNVGSLFSLAPPGTASSQDPPREEIRERLQAQLRQGAFGLKLIGGHLPLTPEATARGIEVANGLGCYVAYHIGTTASSSNLLGVREMPALLGNNRLHIAHLSAYLRGMILDPMEECMEALGVLKRLKGQVISETYLSSQIGTGNGTFGHCIGDEVEDMVTRNCLKMRGYPLTRSALRQAFLDDYAFVYALRGGRIAMIHGQEAVELWEAVGTDITIGFPVTPAISSIYTTLAKDEDGTFIVTAMSTDGGGIPRNFMVERGLALVRLGALTLADYVRKASLSPARMLGLLHKGHLAPGADADITVLDLKEGIATMSLVAGQVIMVDGRVVGSGGTLLVLPEGEEAARASKLKYQVVDLSQSLLYA